MRFRWMTLVGSVVCLLCVNVVSGADTDNAARLNESWITFLSRREFPVNTLYKARPDGTDVTMISGGRIQQPPMLDIERSLVRDVHWTRQSPNGKWFASYAKDALVPFQNFDSQHFMVHIGSIDGSWSRILAPDGEEGLDWSPDSTQIAYSVKSGRVGRFGPGYFRSQLPSTEILTASIDGSNMDYVFEQAGLWEIQDWSPDGKKLLLLHKLTEFQSTNARSPIGELVEYDLARAIASRKERLPPMMQRGDKWVATLDRFLKIIVLGTPGLAPQNARYSPDGKHIAIAYINCAKAGIPVEDRGIMKWHSHGKLALFNVETGTINTIADPPEGIFPGPICWSPNGEEILVSRNLSLDDDREKSEGSPSLGIWAISKDGRQERFITTGWSPDWR